MADSDRPLFYTDLASWWPLISPVEDYEKEAAWIAVLLGRARREVAEVLELGSGGGHCAHWLKAARALTLVDLAPEMLAVSERLNPECTHAQGDMRSIRLGRAFDSVLLHDAVDYMTTEADLAAAFATAREHCRPGGVVVALPDHVRENFASGVEVGGSDAADGRGIRFLEWTTDADATDTRIETEYAFVLREADGRVSHLHERHVTGLFPIATWVGLLEQQGFEVETLAEETDEARAPRLAFLAHRPLDGASGHG